MKPLMVTTGALLAAVPLIGLFIAATLAHGVLFACAIFGIVAVMTAVVATGVFLIAKGLDR